MDEKERSVVEDIFSIRGIQILISTYKLCWELPQTAYMVAILDNYRYNG